MLKIFGKVREKSGIKIAVFFKAKLDFDLVKKRFCTFQNEFLRYTSF